MKIIATNRRALHQYKILQKLEAGISLTGAEIKSVRNKRVNLTDSYVRIKGGEAYLINAYIAHYQKADQRDYDPTRTRKLLLKKGELTRLGSKLTKNLTIVPLKMYLRRNVAKVEIALAKGKRKYEKREAQKERAIKREIRMELKELQKRNQ